MYRVLMATASNLEAFRGLSGEQEWTLRELRTVWADHPVLSTLGKPGDRVHDRIDRILTVAGK